MTSIKCTSCKQTHTLSEIKHAFSENDGKWRLNWTCPVTLKERSVFSKAPTNAPANAPGKPKPKPKNEAPVTETTLTNNTLKSLALKMPVDPVTVPRISAGWDVVLGIVDYLQSQNTTAPPSATLAMARAKALEAQARSTTSSQADSIEYKLGLALGELFGPVCLIKGITRETFSSLMPRDVAVVGAEASPVANAADTIFGSFGGFTEGAVNTFLPEGFETDFNDDGQTADMIDAGQDALDIGAGDESTNNSNNTAETLNTIATATQVILPFL